jgi:hypothetical protein
MNFVEQHNVSLPGYQGPMNLGAARWGQLLTFYNQHRATIGRKRPAKTRLSPSSMWSHGKREILELLDRNGALGIPAQVHLPAPGAVVGHQHQHLSLQAPPVSSRLIIWGD